MKFTHCLYIVFVIEKHKDIFTGGFCAVGGFLFGESSLWREILEGRILGKILRWGNLTEFLYKFLLTVLHYLCQLDFACGDVPGNYLWAIFLVF